MAIRDKDLWEPKRRLETRYFRQLKDITDFLHRAIASEADPYLIAKILRTSIDPAVLSNLAHQIAVKMVTNIAVDTAKTWRVAARQSSKGRSIYEALQHEMSGPVGSVVFKQVQSNAELIRTLPLALSQQVTDYIGRESMKGRRAADIASDIKTMFPDNSRAKALLIARTESSKTSTAITQARAQNFGMEWYEWRTSEDQRVRSSHRTMDRVLVTWNNPPAPEILAGEKSQGHYHAGEIFNCRCYPAPIVNPERLKWPHKVYSNGSIMMFTLSQFKNLVA